MFELYPPDFLRILPELILSGMALFILTMGAVKKAEFCGHITTLSFLLAGGALFLSHKMGKAGIGFEGQILEDDFSYVGKILILIASYGAFSLSVFPLIREKLLSFEYAALTLLATTGMLLMMGANDFINLFVGLEMQGLSLYVLAALNRHETKTAEAALKYFILGALGTVFYLYGAGFLYGFSGSTNFGVLAAAIHMDASSLPLGLYVGTLLIVSALCFKIAAVPFHMWTPDVYEGCPTPVVTFIATAPKVVGVLVLLRLLFYPFMAVYAQWVPLLLALSLVSMVVGTFAALVQTNLKRFLAYSTIGQMGYVLLGIASGPQEGIQAVLMYISLYLVMVLGVFGCVLCLQSKKVGGIQTLEDLSGLSKFHPRLAFLLALFMFSLAGIPPFAGFFSKFYLLKAAISAELYFFATLGILISVVAAAYYLRIIKIMYFDKRDELTSDFYGVLSSQAVIVMGLCGGISLFFCLFSDPFFKLIHHAAVVCAG